MALLAGLCTNVVFGIVRAAVLLAGVRASNHFGGYDPGSIGAYVWLSQGLIGAVAMMGPAPEIADRIKTGDVAIDFIRPVDIQVGYLAGDLGRAAFSLLPRGLPSVLVGALTFGLAMPTTIEPYFLGLLSVTLAVALSFLAQFAVAITGFWLIEARGIRSLYMVAGTFLAGLFVPVHLFPGWLQMLAHATPFPSTLQTPVDVLSGRVGGPAAVDAVAVQMGWIVVVAVLGRLILRAGGRKLEVQGG